MTHTKGPWDKEWSFIQNAARGIEAFRNGESWKDKDGSFEKRAAANISLISAAPDLLEALEALEELARFEFDNFEQHVSVIDKARAAIAKAKGKA